MNSQSTPVHIRLWHRQFWLLSISNFLVSTSVYMLIPTMPVWLLEEQNFSYVDTGLAMGAFGLGLFVFGAFVSFLIQYYRRNMVCVWAMAALGLLLASCYYLDGFHAHFVEASLIILLRFCMGAAFGLSQMVLTSTLIIDTSESFQRTEANYATMWFNRFALSIGPVLGLLTMRIADFDTVLLVGVGCALLSLVLVLFVDFPFRTPADDIHAFSLDRFLLPNGFPLFFNLLLISLAFGLLLSLSLSERFYAVMMSGFLVALLCRRFVFRDAELKSEVVSGLILMGAALLMLITRTQQVVWYVAPFLIGMGIGIISSRFLLFFVKLSRHCQRGTSQSTFMLAWESGLAFGIGLGLAVFHSDDYQTLTFALILNVLALMVYQYIHKWFVKHKNR